MPHLCSDILVIRAEDLFLDVQVVPADQHLSDFVGLCLSYERLADFGTDAGTGAIPIGYSVGCPQVGHDCEVSPNCCLHGDGLVKDAP